MCYKTTYIHVFNIICLKLIFLQTVVKEIPCLQNWNSSSSNNFYLIQLYVIKFVSNLRLVGGFLQALQFPPPLKLTHYIAEILFKVVLNDLAVT
jgi:hypothetical protein